MEKNYFDKNIYLYIIGTGQIICLITLIILWYYSEPSAAIIGQDVTNTILRIKMQELNIKILELELEIKQMKLPPILEPQTKLMVIKTFLIQNPSLVLIPVIIIVSAIRAIKGLK
jgi:hypothetical protein